MDRRKEEEINLAALLDGELRDAVQLEALSTLVERDPVLRAEYEEQSLVKSLLGELDEYKAPDFMATRVMGEIAARRKAQAAPRWRPAVAWFSGVAALLVGFGTTVGLMAPRAVQQAAPLLAESGSTVSQPLPGARYVSTGGLGAQPGLFMEVEYAAPVWEELPMPAGNTDKRIEGFLRFASESHDYRRALRSGGCGAANMADAVLVLDNGDNGTLVHYAAQK